MPSYRRNKDGTKTRIDRGYAKNQKNYQEGVSKEKSSYTGQINPYYERKSVRLKDRDRAAVKKNKSIKASVPRSNKPGPSSGLVDPQRANSALNIARNAELNTQSTAPQAALPANDTAQPQSAFGEIASDAFGPLQEYFMNDPSTTVDPETGDITAAKFEMQLPGASAFSGAGKEITKEYISKYVPKLITNVGWKQVVKDKAYQTIYSTKGLLNRNSYVEKIIQSKFWRTLTKQAKPYRYVDYKTGTVKEAIFYENRLSGTKALIGLGVVSYVGIKLMENLGLNTWQAKAESAQTIGFAANLVKDIDDPQLLLEYADALEMQIQPDSAAQQTVRAIPGIGNVYTTENDVKNAFDLQVQAIRLYAEDKVKQQQEGVAQEQIWADRLAEQERMKVEADERYLQNNLLLEQLKQQAAAENRREDERFYIRQLKLKAEAEEKERERNLAYWRAYWEMSSKSQENNRPSNLKFGLI